MSGKCQDVFGEVGLVSDCVRPSQVCVATCSVRYGKSRDMFGEVGFVSGLVRLGRVFAGTCSSKST